MGENERRRQLACSTDLSSLGRKGKVRDVSEGVQSGGVLPENFCIDFSFISINYASL